jgi:hypothetical protein
MIGSSRHLLVLIGLVAALLGSSCPVDAFVVVQNKPATTGRRVSLAPCFASGPDDNGEKKGGGFMQAIGNFFEELDAFIDDASARRLGNGAAFYGKRKSKFYGEDDENRKQDKTMADPTEDYQGPTSTGLFQWVQDEDGQMRPVTRGKNKVIERPPEFWDRYYEKKQREEEEA